MRKLILKMSMSIDGFVAGPENQIDWIFSTGDDESKKWSLEQVSNAGVHIMGSRTFKDMAAYWPTSTEAFAPPMNDIPKVVFSRSGRPLLDAANTRGLDDARKAATSKPTQATEQALASWASARVASGPLVDEINALKREDGKPIVAHGGVSFAQSLVQAGVVDEYRLTVHPVILGRGGSPFATTHDRQNVTLVDTKRFKGGCVAYIYAKK
jgi:dihydrofolate reductase